MQLVNKHGKRPNLNLDKPSYKIKDYVCGCAMTDVRRFNKSVKGKTIDYITEVNGVMTPVYREGDRNHMIELTPSETEELCREFITAFERDREDDVVNNELDGLVKDFQTMNNELGYQRLYELDFSIDGKRQCLMKEDGKTKIMHCYEHRQKMSRLVNRMIKVNAKMSPDRQLKKITIY